MPRITCDELKFVLKVRSVQYGMKSKRTRIAKIIFDRSPTTSVTTASGWKPDVAPALHYRTLLTAQRVPTSPLCSVDDADHTKCFDDNHVMDDHLLYNTS